MAKSTKTVFYCKECGYESPRFMGQCPACRAWNSFVEAPAAKEAKQPGRVDLAGRRGAAAPGVPRRLSEVEAEAEARVSTGFSELDLVLGGGIVPASLILVGGDPGIGKSTLLLQVSGNLARAGHSVLYISGEESLRQIKLRADRLGAFGDEVRFLCETDLDAIAEILKTEKPETVVIDSIQTICREDVTGAPGSVSQVRESTSVLLQLAKGLGITIFIVGHVTKDGQVAGPRMLEHMVDTVLYFEGDKQAAYRILRGIKNRFGSTNEIGVFEMAEDGLREVPNPSEYLIQETTAKASGSVITAAVEGNRPIMLEIQALVFRSGFGMPRRTAAGTDYNRVNLLMAVLEKRLGYRLSDCDAYINIAGGMRVAEPSLDLGIVMAIVSSYKDAALPDKTLVFGEVGLTGEVRAVSQPKARVAEALKLGFSTCIVPKGNLKALKEIQGLKIIGVSDLKEAVSCLEKGKQTGGEPPQDQDN
ncbi:MAG: DNA repair protein RadA [Lachnospiraceae bacterium]|nr:DNA repair protein RadA [Lachnospiraceae bacterium]